MTHTNIHLQPTDGGDKIKGQGQYLWSTHAQVHSWQWFFCWDPSTAFSEIQTDWSISNRKSSLHHIFYQIPVIRVLVTPTSIVIRKGYRRFRKKQTDLVNAKRIQHRPIANRLKPSEREWDRELKKWSIKSKTIINTSQMSLVNLIRAYNADISKALHIMLIWAKPFYALMSVSTSYQLNFIKRLVCDQSFT